MTRMTQPRGHETVSDDHARRGVARRRVLMAAPVAVAGWLAPVAAEPAYARQRTVERICPAAWGAAPPTYPFVPHTIARLTIHHSGVTFRDNRTAPATLRAIQADHQSRGWPDIAYHLLIDRHGNLYGGRPASAVGNSNTAYDPTGHLLVMCLGNFEVQRVPDAQFSALVDVLAWACTRFGVAPSTIAGHRDYVATACPGRNLYRWIADGTVRGRVARRVDQVNRDNLCGRAGRRRVRRIENGTD